MSSVTHSTYIYIHIYIYTHRREVDKHGWEAHVTAPWEGKPALFSSHTRFKPRACCRISKKTIRNPRFCVWCWTSNAQAEPPHPDPGAAPSLQPAPGRGYGEAPPSPRPRVPAQPGPARSDRPLPPEGNRGQFKWRLPAAARGAPRRQDGGAQRGPAGSRRFAVPRHRERILRFSLRRPARRRGFRGGGAVQEAVPSLHGFQELASRAEEAGGPGRRGEAAAAFPREGRREPPLSPRGSGGAVVSPPQPLRAVKRASTLPSKCDGAVCPPPQGVKGPGAGFPLCGSVKGASIFSPPGVKGGLCRCRPLRVRRACFPSISSSRLSAKGLFPHQAPASTHNPFSCSRTPRSQRRKSHHPTVPSTASSLAETPGHSCTPWRRTTLTTPPVPSRRRWGSSSTSSPSFTPASTVLRIWGKGELVREGFFLVAAAEGASLKCWAAAAICISAALPAFGVSYLNWFLPLLHKSDTLTQKTNTSSCAVRSCAASKASLRRFQDFLVQTGFACYCGITLGLEIIWVSGGKSSSTPENPLYWQPQQWRQRPKWAVMFDKVFYSCCCQFVSRKFQLLFSGWWTQEKKVWNLIIDLAGITWQSSCSVFFIYYSIFFFF